MAIRWTFRSYVAPNGDVEVYRWYQAQGPTVQGRFDRRLHDLQQMAPSEWREPFTKQLEGDCDGLVEIRLKLKRFNTDRWASMAPNDWNLRSY